MSILRICPERIAAAGNMRSRPADGFPLAFPSPRNPSPHAMSILRICPERIAAAGNMRSRPADGFPLAFPSPRNLSPHAMSILRICPERITAAGSARKTSCDFATPPRQEKGRPHKNAADEETLDRDASRPSEYSPLPPVKTARPSVPLKYLKRPAADAIPNASAPRWKRPAQGARHIPAREHPAVQRRRASQSVHVSSQARSFSLRLFGCAKHVLRMFQGAGRILCAADEAGDLPARGPASSSARTVEPVRSPVCVFFHHEVGGRPGRRSAEDA